MLYGLSLARRNCLDFVESGSPSVSHLERDEITRCSKKSLKLFERASADVSLENALRGKPLTSNKYAEKKMYIYI